MSKIRRRALHFGTTTKRGRKKQQQKNNTGEIGDPDIVDIRCPRRTRPASESSVMEMGADIVVEDDESGAADLCQPSARMRANTKNLQTWRDG